MDEVLKKLLDAESRAQRLVEESKERRAELVRQTLAEVRRAEERFRERLPEIHSAFMEKAEARAAQTIAELQRRYDERNQELRRLAENHEVDAVEATLAAITETREG